MNTLDLSITIPLHNEQANISELYSRLTKTLKGLKKSYEIVIVNDGSTDNTLQMLQEIRGRDKSWKIVSLSRGFGYEAAVTAGLEHTTGSTVVLMDGDLQDAPEFVPELLTKLASGYDVVYAQHPKRKDSALKMFATDIFYLAINKLSSYELPYYAGSFSAMTRPVVDTLCSMTERNRYVSGLRAWIGFRQIGINYERKSRFAGKPAHTFQSLVKMALDALFSFSYVPLRLATIMGLIVSFGATLGVLDVLYQKFISHTAILGWSAPTISILVIGGTQLIILGILGEYLGRIYDEVKRRPYYIVSDKIGF